jgi:hypothetical protein
VQLRVLLAVEGVVHEEVLRNRDWGAHLDLLNVQVVVKRRKLSKFCAKIGWCPNHLESEPVLVFLRCDVREQCRNVDILHSGDEVERLQRALVKYASDRVGRQSAIAKPAVELAGIKRPASTMATAVWRWWWWGRVAVVSE